MTRPATSKRRTVRRHTKTPEYSALLAIHEARGTPAERALVQKFVASQQGLVEAYATRWQGDDVQREDLIQQALLGLLEAVSRWHPARAQSGWQRYAFHWMRHSLQQLVHNHVLVRESREVRLDRRRVERVLATAPDLEDAELAQRTGLSLARVLAARCPQPRVVLEEGEL